MHARGVVPVLLLSLAFVACGDDEARSAEPVNLRITVDDGAGTVREATLKCKGDSASGTGFLSRDASKHCANARDLADFLAGRPDRGRPCTQIYGGPQKAHVLGMIGTRAINRRLTRRDGCEIADWDRAEPLLAPSGIKPGVHT